MSPRPCPRYAPFWTAHGRLGMHFMCNLRMSPLSPLQPPCPCLLELSPTRYTICLGRTFVCRCRCCSTALSTPNSCSPLGLICVAETFQNFTAWCNIKMPSFYDYSADATAAVAAAADAAAPGAVGAILLNFNGIFSSANCRMH